MITSADRAKRMAILPLNHQVAHLTALAHEAAKTKPFGRRHVELLRELKVVRAKWYAEEIENRKLKANNGS